MQYEKSKRKIKKIIEGMAGKYRAYNIFKDFIVLSACTISNSVDKQQWQRREKMYMETIKKYTRDEANKFAEMLALMILAYERRMGDFIGELYMTMEFGNDDTGQYFTPYHISKMMAKLTGYNKKDGVISFNDPACGSGGLVVAYADLLNQEDINYQEKLRVTCNDIDFDVVRMCYVQLSLLGIDAIVYQKNTLEPLDKPPGEIWFTPMHVLNKAKEQQEKESKKTKRMVNAMQRLLDLEKQKPLEKTVQLNLFEEVL